MSEREVWVGDSLYARTWGEPSDLDHVILLHDSLGCVDLWRDFPSLLASRLGRQVIAYDRLGYGRSMALTDMPTFGFVEAEGAQVIQLIDELEIPRAVLFGYSIGGSMALSTAAAFPDRVSAVIGMSSIVFVEDRTREGLAEARIRFAAPEQMARLRRWHGEKADWVIRAWLDVWATPPFATWSLAPALPGVTCPVLALHGDRDEFGSPEYLRVIGSLVSGPSRQVLLRDCGHMPQREMPERVLTEVVDFMDSLIQ